MILSIRLLSHWDSGIRFRCYCDEKGRTGGSEPQTGGGGVGALKFKGNEYES